ncbi:MAG TPA: VIT1/CCC1 family protein [bacterium]
MSKAGALNPAQFALNEYRDYVTYRELAAIETVPKFKEILSQLIEHEEEDYRFWRELAPGPDPRISGLEIRLIKLMRKVLGLTFTAKFLERNERDAIRRYSAFAESAPPELAAKVREIVEHEMFHEREMIGQIQEERVEFLGSIVLGANDGLIELTGALVGFTFALANPFQAGLFGVVTGVAASLSMAASAYMQARHEHGRNPKKAAAYTGLSYLVVVAALVTPFVLAPTVSAALTGMGAVILLLIAGFSGYGAVLFDRDFKRQFGEMLCFSVGVAALAYVLGSAVRGLLGGDAI